MVVYKSIVDSVMGGDAIKSQHPLNYCFLKNEGIVKQIVALPVCLLSYRVVDVFTAFLVNTHNSVPILCSIVSSYTKWLRFFSHRRPIFYLRARSK